LQLQEQKRHVKDSHKKHKKEKKHKKKKKKHHHQSESSNDEGTGDLDRMLAAKYSQLRKRMEKAELQQALAPDSDTSSNSSEAEDAKSKHRAEPKCSSSSESDYDAKRKKRYGLVVSQSSFLLWYTPCDGASFCSYHLDPPVSQAVLTKDLI
jgi:hypothetical protein